MGTWGEVERELLATRQANGGAIDFDGVRRGYLAKLAAHTGRNVILYETAGFAPPQGASPDDVQIALDPDVGAFMEVVNGLPKDVGLDLILHSPGGTAEAAEAIVSYLRGRFPGLRVIVPIAAMSAATMMAMSADEIIMGAHSQLGPIDPQLTIPTPEGPRSAPAEAIRQQFADAQADLAANPSHMAAWLPILRSYAPALLQICQDAALLSKRMVTDWLTKYMFAGDPDGSAKAVAVADYLSDYTDFKSHSRRVDRDALRTRGVKVLDLESDPILQDLVLSVHHATNHTMTASGMVKLVENHLGKAYIRTIRTMAAGVPMLTGGPGGPLSPPSGPVASPPANRAARRRAERGRA